MVPCVKEMRVTLQECRQQILKAEVKIALEDGPSLACAVHKQHPYAMLCCAMLCYAMLCYAMLCYAMLCYAMLCYAMLCYAAPWAASGYTGFRQIA